MEAKDAAKHPAVHRSAPQQRTAWPQMPIVNRLRHPVIDQEIQHRRLTDLPKATVGWGQYQKQV